MFQLWGAHHLAYMFILRTVALSLCGKTFQNVCVPNQPGYLSTLGTDVNIRVVWLGTSHASIA